MGISSPPTPVVASLGRDDRDNRSTFDERVCAVSFKDDFVEALRSVKRDFFREYEYTEQEGQADQKELPDSAAPEQAPTVIESPPPAPSEPVQPSVASAAEETERMEDIYHQPSARSEDEYDGKGYQLDDDLPVETTPYRSYDDSAAIFSKDDYSDHGGGRGGYIDFGDNGLYDDDKTIISKNTIIRGAVETDDSIRLLGQVMGDIDCKANIVVAGKVRGNTSAANAYIFDAQVDGDVRCEDVITVSNDAWVLGNLRAQQAEIDGKIKGNMEIRHMVSIGASSSILGDISTDELEIKRGAFVNGQIMMYSPSRDVLDRFDRFDE